MRTFPITNENGQCFAFEVENAYIGPRRIAKLLADLAGTSDFRSVGLITAKDDVRLRFKYNNHDFLVWEPFGDNSRFWIGPAEEQHTAIDVSELRAAFERYRPPILTKLVGDLVSLNFRALFHWRI